MWITHCHTRRERRASYSLSSYFTQPWLQLKPARPPLPWHPFVFLITDLPAFFYNGIVDRSLAHLLSHCRSFALPLLLVSLLGSNSVQIRRKQESMVAKVVMSSIETMWNRSLLPLHLLAFAADFLLLFLRNISLFHLCRSISFSKSYYLLCLVRHFVRLNLLFLAFFSVLTPWYSVCMLEKTNPGFFSAFSLSTSAILSFL